MKAKDLLDPKKMQKIEAQLDVFREKKTALLIKRKDYSQNDRRLNQMGNMDNKIGFLSEEEYNQI